MLNSYAALLGSRYFLGHLGEDLAGTARGMDRLLIEFLADPANLGTCYFSEDEAGVLLPLYRDFYESSDDESGQWAAWAAIRATYYADAFLGPYPLLATLFVENYKNKAEKWFEGNRDHFAHQLRVYHLGLYLCAKSARLREAILAQIGAALAEDVDLCGQERAFHQAWRMAALTHDVGYLFEVGEEQELEERKKIFKALSDYLAVPLSLHFEARRAAGLLVAVRGFDEGAESRLYSDSGSYSPRKLVTIDDLAKTTWRDGERVFAHLNRAVARAGLSAADDGLEKMLLLLQSTKQEKRPKYTDHGIMGALVIAAVFSEFEKAIGTAAAVAKQCDQGLSLGAGEEAAARYGAQVSAQLVSRAVVLMATEAVALHNLDKSSMKQTKFFKDEALAKGLDIENYSIGLENNALAFLLCLSDSLQDWGRRSNCLWKASSDSPEGVDITSRREQLGFVAKGESGLIPLYGDTGDRSWSWVFRQLAAYLDSDDLKDVLCDEEEWASVAAWFQRRPYSSGSLEEDMPTHARWLGAQIERYSEWKASWWLVEEALRSTDPVRKVAGLWAYARLRVRSKEPRPELFGDESWRDEHPRGAFVEARKQVWEADRLHGLFSTDLQVIRSLLGEVAGDPVRLVGECLRPYNLMVDSSPPGVDRADTKDFLRKKEGLLSTLGLNILPDADPRFSAVDHEGAVLRGLTALKSGSDRFDLVLLPHRLIGLLVENDWVEPWDEYLAEEDLGRILALRELGCYVNSEGEENVYGIPFVFLLMLLGVRTDWVNHDAGELRSWGGLLDQLRRVEPPAERAQGSSRFLIRPKRHISLWYDFQNLVAGFGLDPGKTNSIEEAKELLTGQPMADVLDYFLALRSLSVELEAPPNRWDLEYRRLQAGSSYCGFVWTDSAFLMMDRLREGGGGDAFEFLPMPRSEDSFRYQLEAWCFFLPRKGRATERAVEFVRSWTFDRELQTLWTAVGGCSPLAEVWSDPQLDSLSYVRAVREMINNGDGIGKERFPKSAYLTRKVMHLLEEFVAAKPEEVRKSEQRTSRVADLQEKVAALSFQDGILPEVEKLGEHLDFHDHEVDD